MDKLISSQVIQQKKRKRWLYVALIVVLLAGAAASLRFALDSSLSKKKITTAVVERGDIENTLTASGLMLPEFEQVITSAISASIQQVLLDAGTPVQPGQAVLELDKAAAQVEYGKLQLALASKRN